MASVEVTFVAESPIGLYTLEPLIREARARGMTVYVYCTASVRPRVIDSLGAHDLHLRELEALAARSRVRRLAHRTLELLFTPRNFSPQYRLLTRPSRSDLSLGARSVALVSRLMPHWPPHLVNHRLHAVVGMWMESPFPTRKVVVASRFSLPHLLCAADAEVFTVMESWDHPVKTPVGYVSQTVFAWNADLARDWSRQQGDVDVRVGYPLKLRDALQIGPCANKGSRTVSNRAMYAAGTSSLSYVNNLHEEEQRLIRVLCKATQRAGWTLLIKPKPNGPVGDFDHFADEFRHVRIGQYRGAESSTDYYLDAEYNAARYSEACWADVVISAITTFALDAALLGAPVLQLDLRELPGFPELARFSTNHHLSAYLLRDPELALGASSSAQLECEVARALERPERAYGFSSMLRQWLVPAKGLRESLGGMLDVIAAGPRDAE